MQTKVIGTLEDMVSVYIELTRDLQLCCIYRLRAHKLQDLTFYCGQQKKKERVSRVESVHPHPHHHPHLTQSRTLFAARAACAESHSGLKSVFMLAKKILSEMSIFHFESNLRLKILVHLF